MRDIYSTIQKPFRSAALVLLTLVMTGFFGSSVMGQLPMTRTVFTAPYTPITTGGGATVSTIGGDDGTQVAIPIGFTFNYLGTNYTTIDACANGWASFASGGSNTWTNTNLFTTTTPNQTLAPWWDDLELIAGTGSVLYQTQGVSPNQTFTIQWTDVHSYRVSSTGRVINFQLVLYETTNVIEFRYSTTALPGTLNTSESASIGIEGAGGAGLFLDAVSGSSFINQSFMNTTKWPIANLRFTPGAPVAIPGGVYTVGLAGTYPNLSEAIANVNHRGISGPITLSLIDAVYDSTALGGYNIFPLMLGPVTGNSSTNTITIQPVSGTSTLSYRGASSGSAGTQASITALGTTAEPILAVVGTDYLTVRNLVLNSVGGVTGTSNLVDRGLYVLNNTATNGAQNNLFDNITVNLRNNSTSTIGIQQNTLTIPTSATGANSGNMYMNLTINTAYSGIYLLGNATFPDIASQIGNWSPTSFNTIGNATAFAIGSGTLTTQGYGIRISNQIDAKVYNNDVRNVSVQGLTDGILCEAAQGATQIYNNKVSGVRNNSTTSTSNACGIRANVATTAGQNLYVYNNMVTDVTSAYTGAATATRIIKGIFVQAAGGGVTTSSINVDGNSVRIENTALNASSSCYEIGTATGPVIRTRNNSFTNFTGAQTAPAVHVAWQSTSATSVGNTGSVSNYNNLYVANTTQGFVGQGATTTYATLGNWQAAMVGQDANSVTGDPSYVSSTDLHATGLVLNNVGNYTGSAWITTDIDNQARAAGTPDIGADEFAPALIDMKASALTAPPLPLACYSATEPCSVTVVNNGLATIDFSVNPTTVTVNVTGAATATLTTVLNTGTLAIGASQVVYMGTVNMSAAGTYTFNGFTTVAGDGVPANDAFSAVNITVTAGTASFSSTAVCDGSSVTLTSSGASGNVYQWQVSTDFGLTWANETGPGATTTSYTVIPTDTVMYRMLICGSLASNADTVIWSPVLTPTVTADTVCGADSITLSAIAGSATINWYNVPSGGSPIGTGTTYSDFITTTTTYYVEAVNGGTIGSVGLFDNSAGGGQQTSTAWTGFDVFTNCTLVGCYVYPGAAGTAILEWRNSAGVLITSSSLTVTAGDVGTRMFFPLGWNLVPGTGYRMQQGTGSVSMFRNSAGVSFPYTLPGVLSINNSSAFPTFYYWGYNWQILTGCPGPRVPVTALSNPPDSIFVSPLGGVLCAGDSLAMNITSTDSTYDYEWVPGTGLTDSLSSSTTASPLETTTYIVYAESPVSGCKTSDTLTVVVNPLPVGYFTPTDTTICIGDSSLMSFAYEAFVSVTDTVDNAIPDGVLTGDTSYITISGGPSVMTSSSVVSVCFNMTHTWDDDMDFYLISPAGTILELSTDNAGSGDNYFGTCFTPTAVASITTAVAPCTGDWIPEGAGGFNVFNGQNSNGVWKLWMVDDVGVDPGVLLDWSLSLQNGVASWTWSSDPVGFSSTADSVWVSPDSTTIYTVTLQDSTTGCTQDYSWTLNVNPPLDVFILPAAPTVCPGDSVALVATATGGDGAHNYLWTPSGISFSVATITPTGEEMHVVTITDGCTTPAVSDTVYIHYADSILGNVSADTTICEGQTVTLTCTVTEGGGAYIYGWSTGDSTASIAVSPITSTTYYVTFTDNCGNSGVDSVVVNVNPLPVAAFTFLPASPTAGASVDFTDASTGSPTSWSWDFGGLGTSTIANPSFTFPSAGSVDVTLIVTNGCGSDTLTETISILVAGSQPIAGGSASVYPNPNNGTFNLGVTGMDGRDLDIRVVNMVGQTIHSQRTMVAGRELELPVSLNAPAGVYMLEVRSGEDVVRFNVTVQ